MSANGIKLGGRSPKSGVAKIGRSQNFGSGGVAVSGVSAVSAAWRSRRLVQTGGGDSVPARPDIIFKQRRNIVGGIGAQISICIPDTEINLRLAPIVICSGGNLKSGNLRFKLRRIVPAGGGTGSGIGEIVVAVANAGMYCFRS